MQSRPSEAYIDGRWVQGAGGQLAIVNPATEVEVALALDAAPETVVAAVRSARLAFELSGWREAPLGGRASVIEAATDILAARADELAVLGTTEMGAPISVSRAMVAGSLALIRTYIDASESLCYSYIRRDAAGQSLIERGPVGVVGAITPWNGPLAATINKVIPALLTGCSVVLKPAPETPFDPGILAEALTAAGLPDGVFNVVTGGAATGAALVEAEGVDKISFTGSTSAGRKVGEVCGRLFRRQSLELGGKSAAIVLDDAPLEDTVRNVVSGNFFNSGQACIAVTRVLVPEGREKELIEAMAERTAALRLGDPLDEATEIGPLVTRRQLDRVEAYVGGALSEGATCAVGGVRPESTSRGWFFEPTILTGVGNQMTVAREEVFGPVMSVIAYQDEAEAVAIANDSAYGLHGAVFSADPERAVKIARSLQTGSASVNSSGLTPATPYGGVKGSGVGREHGPEGLASFLEYHAVVVPAEVADRRQLAGTPVL